MKDILDEFRNGRHEFENGHLEGIEGKAPYDLFELWMTEAVNKKEQEPNAFTLSTVSKEFKLSSRIVYFKDLIDGSFIFYTNYLSQKGRDIKENNKVSMLFFWPESSRQIRIEGVCSKVDSKISDDYFASRPRGSQIGAWASHQSETLLDREELVSRVAEFEKKYPNIIPRPEHWGGYKIKPTRFEFWQGKPSRLHDRFIFEIENGEWNLSRINP